jgi:UDP-3-O-[3-hydroxymyristoyl] N-acetylglucosamine deacetylase / 3-hydroxyacyl-[acyl-carrier-protein] dehydratase
VGLHTGAEVTLRLERASSGQGIVFRRRDLSGRRIPARLESVAATERRTALRVGADRVDTVEHLLAAVYAGGIDDLDVLLDGPELPILDGSFAPFVALLEQAGRVETAGRTATLRLDHQVEVAEAEAHYQVEPADGLTIDLTLEYAEPVIGRQRAVWAITPAVFAREIAPARTFGFLAEVEPLRERGLLAGATESCAMVLSPVAVLNTTPRWPDEFARHKLGDLTGDLSLLGARLNVRVIAERPSHRGNLSCARALARVARIVEE